jgi:glycine amidinotransferase
MEKIACAVCSYNEWDPLEEVIVGELRDATVPEWNIAVAATMPGEVKDFFQQNAGKHFPQEYIEAACSELDVFSETLRGLGITVRRPTLSEKAIAYNTPHWKSDGGLYSAMPRDCLLVVGDTIIEAPMAWRSRYFETDSFRPLLKEYFRQGAKWISAPRPQLLSESYDENYDGEFPYLTKRYAVTEFEPNFDAADFIRCGKDIFVQRSHVTNEFGIEWVRRHIGSDFRLHVVDVVDSAPMHIDATLMPIAPGKLLVHPTRIENVPPIFKDWEVRRAPQPAIRPDHTLYMSSCWLNMNVLMLAPKIAVVEKQEYAMQQFLYDWGIEVIAVDFHNVIRFGGAFHCVTADIRRRGELQSYF